MEHPSSFLTGFLTGQRLRTRQAGIGSGPGGGTDFYDWASRNGGPAELTDPDTCARFAAQYDGVTASDNGTFLVQLAPVCAYGNYQLIENSGRMKTIFFFSGGSPVHAGTSDLGDVGIPAVTDGRLSIPYARYGDGSYSDPFYYLYQSSSFRVRFERELPYPLSNASFALENAPIFRGQAFIDNQGWVDIPQTSISFANNPYTANAYQHDIAPSSGSAVTIQADCLALPRITVNGNALRFNAAEWIVTSPVYRATPTSFTLPARPGAVPGSPINEEAKTFTNPVTGEIISFQSFSYNYQTRTYTLTLPDGGKLDVTFGDNAITINDLGGGDGTEPLSGPMEALYPDNAHNPVTAPDGAFHKDAFLSGLAAGLRAG